jgi:hypothetical protein
MEKKMTEIVQQYIRDDIEIVKGGDWHETVNFYSDDAGTVVLDTTGYTLTRTIRKSFLNGDLLDELSVANGKIVHTTASGQFNLNLTTAQIEAYDFTVGEYRDVLDYGDGNKQVIRLGNVKVV